MDNAIKIPRDKDSKSEIKKQEDLHLKEMLGNTIYKYEILKSFLNKRISKFYKNLDYYSFDKAEIEMLYCLLEFMPETESKKYYAYYRLCNKLIDESENKYSIKHLKKSNNTEREETFNSILKKFEKFKIILRLKEYSARKNSREYFKLNSDEIKKLFDISMNEIKYLLRGFLEESEINYLILCYPINKNKVEEANKIATKIKEIIDIRKSEQTKEDTNIMSVPEIKNILDKLESGEMKNEELKKFHQDYDGIFTEEINNEINQLKKHFEYCIN